MGLDVFYSYSLMEILYLKQCCSNPQSFNLNSRSDPTFPTSDWILGKDSFNMYCRVTYDNSKLWTTCKTDSTIQGLSMSFYSYIYTSALLS